MPIRAVFFDLDDTLHDDTATYRRAAEEVARVVAAEHGVAPADLLAAYVDEADRFWIELTPASFGTSLGSLRPVMWGAALRRCGVDDEALAARCAALYEENRLRFLEIWPGVHDLLADLRARGIKTGIITNGFAETHHEKIELLALTHAVDTILVADETGYLKPDPRIFELAAANVGVPCGDCAMVGDRFERDVTGGRAAGMRTVWMNVRGEAVPEGHAAPDAEATTVAEMAAALARIGDPAASRAGVRA